MPKPTEPSLTALADAAFREAAVQVVRLAKQTGTPLIVWENGEIRAIPPDEIQEGKAYGSADPALPRQD